MFSKACEYGLKALIFISDKSSKGVRVNVTEISKKIDSPPAFTAKILQQLVRAGIIKSAKGPSGGFEISEEKMDIIKLTHIVDAIDGDKIYNGCALGLNECSSLKPCPLHEKFAKIRAELKLMLDATSLHDLALILKDGTTFLKL